MKIKAKKIKLILLSILFSSLFHNAIYAQTKDISYPTYLKPSSMNIHHKGAVLSQKAPDINSKALKTALQAYHCAAKRGHIKKPYLTVIDYSVASNKPRLWTFDLHNDRLLFRSFVAHGKNSGKLKARYFSDRPESRQSSLGLFVTGEKYSGSHGASLRLNGLDHGFNSRARPRAIVIHGASYVSQQFLKKHGRLGLSWGCPAISNELAKPLINKIKDGAAVFTYYPTNQYLKGSKLLKC